MHKSSTFQFIIFLGGLLSLHIYTRSITPTSAATCNFFVSPSGNDSSPGSLSSPFRTIQHATDTAPANTSICVRSGTYTIPYNNGDPDAIVLSKGGQTLIPYNNESVTIKGSVAPAANIVQADRGMLDITSPGNTVTGLTLKDFPGIGIRIFSSTNISNNTVSNNTIHNIGTKGMTINGVKSPNLGNIKILNNTVEYCNINPTTKQMIYPNMYGGGKDCSAIVFQGARGTLDNPTIVEGNIIRYISAQGAIFDSNWGQSSGIIYRKNTISKVYGAEYIHASDNIIYDSNLLYEYGPIGLHSFVCLLYSGGETVSGENLKSQPDGLISRNVTISNNLIMGCMRPLIIGVDHKDIIIDNLTVRGNTVVNTGDMGWNDESCKGGACPTLRIRAGVRKEFGEGIYDRAFTNSRMEDNIFLHAGNYRQTMFSAYDSTGASFDRPPRGMTVRNNIWSVSPGSGFTSAIITNPKLTGSSGNDLQFPQFNINSPPANIANSFKLLSGSPAINKAVTNTLTYDYFSAKRPQGTKNDMGAHEYTGAISTSPSPEPTSWDFNKDTKINLFDFSYFIQYFNFSNLGFPDLVSFISSL